MCHIVLNSVLIFVFHNLLNKKKYHSIKNNKIQHQNFSIFPLVCSTYYLYFRTENSEEWIFIGNFLIQNVNFSFLYKWSFLKKITETTKKKFWNIRSKILKNCIKKLRISTLWQPWFITVFFIKIHHSNFINVTISWIKKQIRIFKIQQAIILDFSVIWFNSRFNFPQGRGYVGIFFLTTYTKISDGCNKIINSKLLVPSETSNIRHEVKFKNKNL